MRLRSDSQHNDPRSKLFVLQSVEHDERFAMTSSRTRKETYEDGLAMRKSVLGSAHVEKSLSNVTEFSRPIQELVTEYCWGGSVDP